MKLMLVLVVLVAVVRAYPAEDKIDKMPGFEEPLDFALYGGYLYGGTHPERGEMWLYYFAAMAVSGVPAASAPLVTWFQGGPGCSSLMGMMTENGPFQLDGASGHLRRNPDSWNRAAHMVWIESPVGVGYSFDSGGNYTLGDNETFAMNMHALQSFLAKFPELSSNPWYLSGESYGGHYLPGTAYFFLKDGAGGKKPNGFLLGNPWTDDTFDGNSIPLWIWSHTLCSLDTWVQVREACNLDEANLAAGRVRPAARFHDHRQLRSALSSDDAACNAALNTMYKQVGTHISQYDIYWPCTPGGDFQCLDYSRQTAYFNRPDVRKALHANDSASWPWSVCSTVLNYDQYWPSMLPVYDELAQHYELMIYSGDVTWNCDTLGTMAWIRHMNWTETSGWANWFDSTGQVGGYVRKWKQMVLVTVRDAGHMVPTFQPGRGFDVLKKFLSGEFRP